jgi:hypothetical protein
MPSNGCASKQVRTAYFGKRFSAGLELEFLTLLLSNLQYYWDFISILKREAST